MFTLIRGGDLYAPEPMGRRDILICGDRIVRIGGGMDPPPGFDVRVVDARGGCLVPGFFDLHVHLLGGGGEAGFSSRTPEIAFSSIVRAGVTTVVGCLGTDDVARFPESLLAKAYQLEEEGISTFIYTGSYRVPPRTITGSVQKDVALIPKMIGVGEVAVSDHRSSQPSYEELCRLSAEARVGGMLGGKPGVVHVHMGDGPGGLEPILRMARQTEIPIGQFLPTHVSRNENLMEQAVAFAQAGGNIDFTAGGRGLSFEADTGEAVLRALAEGVSPERITMSSDSNGSMPVFDSRGEVVRLAVGQIANLHAEWRGLVEKGLALETALLFVTRNPALRAGVGRMKGSVEEGKDADLVILDRELSVETVISRGRVLMEHGELLVRGVFET